MLRKNLFIYALLAGAFLILYQDVLIHIMRGLTTRDGSYGILIIGVSLYLVWIKRHDIRQLQPEPAILPGALLLFGGCFIFFAGKLGSTILVQQISMIPVILGAVLLLAGFSFFKLFLLPVGYLVFLTGAIEMLMGSIAIYLQRLSAWIASLLFKLIRMPVFLDDTIIELPHISLEVVRSCSGINHIVAFLALALPLALLTQKTRTRKFILILSALLIAFFANGLRVTLIGIYALFNEGADLHGPNEVFYVSFIFFFGLAALVLLSGLLRRWDSKKQPEKNEKTEAADRVEPQINDQNAMSRKQRLSLTIASGIFLVALAFVHLYTPKAVALDQPLDTFPTRIAGFAGEEIDKIGESLRPFPADKELMRRYQNGAGKSVNLYIGYFEIQDRSRKIIDYRRAWMHEEGVKIALNKGKQKVEINKTRIRKSAPPRYAYFWYQMDDRIITSQYTGKIFTFVNALLKRRNNAAVVVASTKSQDKEVLELMSEVIKISKRYFADF